MQVINGNKDKKEQERIERLVFLCCSWQKQFAYSVQELDQAGFVMTRRGRLVVNEDITDILKKAVFQGVKYICYSRKIEYENISEEQQSRIIFTTEVVANYVMYAMAQLKIKDLLELFPVSKVYDGHRYETKDYFYTMAAMCEKGLDSYVGGFNGDLVSNVFDLLCDYENREIRTLMLVYIKEVLEPMYEKTKKPNNSGSLLENVFECNFQPMPYRAVSVKEKKQRPTYLRVKKGQ